MTKRHPLLSFKKHFTINVTFEFIFLVAIVFLFIVIMSDIATESKNIFAAVISDLGKGFLGYVAKDAYENQRIQTTNLEPYYIEQAYNSQNFNLQPNEEQTYLDDLQLRKQMIEQELEQINQTLNY